ncbi:MAG: hypothetical protein H0U78_00750 [Rickettsiaceae bacterium]|nr:hypothetical protein [Rickettsiaceae bacterium]
MSLDNQEKLNKVESGMVKMTHEGTISKQRVLVNNLAVKQKENILASKLRI